MKRTFLIGIATFIILVNLIRCGSPEREIITKYISTDSLEYNILADTIIYDVLINNPDPNDFWKTECLQYLNKSTFIDALFEDVYSGTYTAYHYLDNTPLSIKDIKDMENSDGFSREAIGKIQFKEIWKYSRTHMVLKKEVLSITLGVEHYNSRGELSGYNPVFKLMLN